MISSCPPLSSPLFLPFLIFLSVFSVSQWLILFLPLRNFALSALARRSFGEGASLR